VICKWIDEFEMIMLWWMIHEAGEKQELKRQRISTKVMQGALLARLDRIVVEWIENLR
jgi:hypothetical protein